MFSPAAIWTEGNDEVICSAKASTASSDWEAMSSTRVQRNPHSSSAAVTGSGSSGAEMVCPSLVMISSRKSIFSRISSSEAPP